MSEWMNKWMKFDQTKVTDSFLIPCGFLVYAFVLLWETFSMYLKIEYTSTNASDIPLIGLGQYQN